MIKVLPRVIVPLALGAKVIVGDPPMLSALLIAWRSEPSPLSLVVVTSNPVAGDRHGVAGGRAERVAQTRRQRQRDRFRRHRFAVVIRRRKGDAGRGLSRRIVAVTLPVCR